MIDVFRIAYFIILNTLVFHEVLSTQWSKINSLRRIQNHYQTRLRKEWKAIETDINYKEIFKLSGLVLDALPTGRHTEDALSNLKDLALSVVESGAQHRHDLMGRIYHKLLLNTMGGYYATYYTSVPAAVLISDLLVKHENLSWDFKDVSKVSNMQVIDPACGSGTLLASTYAALRDKFILDHPAPTSKDLAIIHKALMEHGFYGLDVLDYAAHLTLTTLAMQNPKSKFQGSKIRTLRNGVDKDGNVFLGALDYLNTQSILTPRKTSGPTDDAEEGVFNQLLAESFDIVVMNPPFSRSANPNLKFGYETPLIRQKMGDKLKQLTKELGLEGIGVAGLGAHFIVLADKLLKPKGRLGIVIPRHILSGVSWTKIREIFMKNYNIEYIVSNFDPKSFMKDHGWCWSENTDLGEVLIVATKLTEKESPKRCCYVNVSRRPKNEVESLLLSQTIQSEVGKLTGTLREGSWSELSPTGNLWGYAYLIDRSDMTGNWHYGCVFSHPELNKLILDISSNSNLEPLGQHLSSMGRDIAIIKRSFHKSCSITSYPLLWGHQSSMNTINLGDGFIEYGVPQQGDKSAELHAQYASKLLIAERPHINTECLLAAEVRRPVLATAFWEVKLHKESMKSLLLLWLNSTYGFMLALGAGANSEGPIFKIKQEHLNNLIIPKADNDLLNHCEDFYSKIQAEQFLPFPQEFDLAKNGKGTREKIDVFFQKELGLPLLSEADYLLLSTEPAQTMQRRSSTEQEEKDVPIQCEETSKQIPLG